MAKKFALIKKITLSEVSNIKRASGGFKPKQHFGADADGNFAEFLIMRVFGVVNGYKAGTTNYGDYYSFNGNFAAINHDGEEFRSPICIMPPPADSLLKSAVDSADGAPVQMAFDVLAVPDAGDKGYKFKVVPLMQESESDPLAGLIGGINDKYALPAPKHPELPLSGASEPGPQVDSAMQSAAVKDAPAAKVDKKAK